MSVILLSLNHYKAVYNKACTYRHKKILDIDYCYTLSSGMSDNRIKHLIKQWYQMNYLSYCYRYGKNIDGKFLQDSNETIHNWDYEQIKDKPCNPYQMLKLLQSIRYQIEEDNFKEDERKFYNTSLQILNRAINSIQDSIISNNPEYKAAKWCIE